MSDPREYATRRLAEATAAWRQAKDAERAAWAELTLAIAQADDAGLPRKWIADTAGVARQTVYSLLGTTDEPVAE